MASKRNAWMLAIVLPVFFVLNTALNLLNRWSLGIYGFKFPILLTACHAACSFMFMLPGVLLSGQWPRYKATLRRQWKGIGVIGCCVAINIAFNNLSLVYISLSLNQVIKSSIPIVTAVVSAILEGRKPHADEFGALVLLSVGVSLAIAEASAAGNALGVTLCVISVLSGATQLNASGRVLSEKMDSVQLAFFSAPVTSLCLFPVFFVREYSDFVEYFARDHYLSLAIILVGSVIAAAYNVVHYALVAITDPVSTCVLGQIKVIAIMVLSAACLGEGRDFTPPMIAGCICAVLGFSFYSWARVQRQTLAGLIAAGLKTPGGSTPKETPKRNLIKAVRSFQGSPMPTPYALRSASVLRSRMTVSKVELALSPPRVGYAS